MYTFTWNVSLMDVEFMWPIKTSLCGTVWLGGKMC